MPGDYAEVDDFDVVTISRADGTPVLFMPLSAFLKLCRPDGATQRHAKTNDPTADDIFTARGRPIDSPPR